MFKNSRGLLFAVFTALTLSACGGGSVGGGDDNGGDPGTPGGGGNTITGISILVGAPSVQAGRSVLVRATITGTGTLSGRTVTFSTSAGTFNSAADSTDIDGNAERQLTAPNQAGQVTVTVSSGGFSASQTIPVTPGAVANIDVEPLPDRLPLGGTSLVQALVVDTFGNPIEGERIQFTAQPNNTRGRFPTGSTATTDANGFARVDYQAGTTPGTDTLRAQANNGVFDQATLIADPANAAVGSIDLTLARTNLNAGGSSTSATALVLDGDGDPIQGVQVGFSATGGTIPSSGTTNAFGRAVVQYTPPPTGGTFTVRVEVGDLSDEETVIVAREPQVVTSIDLQTSSNDLSSNAQSTTSGVQITATVLDSANGIVPGQSVSFSTTSGILTPLGTASTANNVVTDAAGQARVALTVGSNPRNRPITVTVRTGSVTRTLLVNVVGTRFSNIEGPAALRAGATTSNTYTVRLQDADSVGIAGQQVRFLGFVNGSATSTILGTATTASTPKGEASIAISPAANVSQLRLVAELVTQSGEAALTSAPFDITVSNLTLSFDNPNSLNQIPINTNHPVVVRLQQAGGATPPATVIRLSVTRGAVTSAGGVNGAFETTTGTAGAEAGVARFTVRGSNNGPVTITAVAIATGLTVSTQDSVYVAPTPARIDLLTSPATIGTNSTSEIRATVRDADGNRVAGATVNFSIVTDPTGGSLSSTTGVTNDVGVASVNYRSSSVASAKDGVTLRAAIASAPSVTPAIATLTVGNQALRITLGTSNVINKDGDTLYKLPYVASVKDAAGNPVPEAEFTLNVRPLFYRKGQKVFVEPVWVVESSAMTCRAEDIDDNGVIDRGEDLNSNGILDAGEDLNADGILDTGEDVNSNGVLDPSDGTNVPRTLDLRDSDATVEFAVTYPRDRSGWVVVELSATARVAGSEAIERAVFTLPAAAEDVNTEDTAPPGQFSPFGVVRDCTVGDTGAYAKITTTREEVNDEAVVTVMVNLEGTANKPVTIPLFASVQTASDQATLEFLAPANGNRNITIPAGQLSGSTTFQFRNNSTTGRIIPVSISMGKPVNAEEGFPNTVVIDVRP